MPDSNEINDPYILGLKLICLITIMATMLGATNWINDDKDTFVLRIGLRLSQIGIGLTLLRKLCFDLPNSVLYPLILSYCFSLAMPAITSLVKSKR